MYSWLTGLQNIPDDPEMSAKRPKTRSAIQQAFTSTTIHDLDQGEDGGALFSLSPLTPETDDDDIAQQASTSMTERAPVPIMDSREVDYDITIGENSSDKDYGDQDHSDEWDDEDSDAAGNENKDGTHQLAPEEKSHDITQRVRLTIHNK